MSVESTVRWFHSHMQGAPQMGSVTNGSLLGVLKACLIDGFGATEAQSVVVSGGVATVTFGADHRFYKFSVIEITGATPAELNDEWRVEEITGTTFTFNCPGIPDGAATGTISVRIPPIPEWSTPFIDEANHKIVLRPDSLDSNRFFLRVDDAHGRSPRVRAYEDMTGIDTGTDPFPTFAQLAETSFIWGKSWAAASSDRPWYIFGNKHGFYYVPHLLSAWASYPQRYSFAYGFFDPAPFDPSDLWATTIVGFNGANESWPNQNFGIVGSTAGKYCARNVSGVTKSIQTTIGGMGGFHVWGNQNDTPGNTTYVWPGPAGGLPLFEKHLGFNSFGHPQTGIRSTIPGVYAVPIRTNDPFFFNETSELTYFPLEHSGGKMVAVPQSYSSAAGGVCLVDVVGPWSNE